MNKKPLLKMHDITKSFFGVKVLESVNFDLYGNEVHCLVGENGAGKSTLMKILSGAYTKDEGDIYINGKKVNIKNPAVAKSLGISTIYQELDLVPSLSVCENIFLGNEIANRFGIIDKEKTKKMAKDLLEELDIKISLDALVEELGIAQKQFVATLKALSIDSKILIMDEPSAVISGKELDILFRVIRLLKEKGLGIIYISHRLSEIFEIGDRVTVLRDGKKVKDFSVKEVNEEELVSCMVGRKIEDYFFKKKVDIGEDVLTVKNINRKGVLNNVSFQLRKGEILGIFGLVGAGRTELARAITGVDLIDGGEILLKGAKVEIKSPSRAIELGISVVPEDRKGEGLISGKSIEENISLPIIRKFRKLSWFIDFDKLFKIVISFIKDMSIKTNSMYELVENLSGGNQQKVVLAKFMATKFDVLLMDEPTRGIDVGTKVEIYKWIHKLVKEGKSIILFSSEIPEILSISDRILVMCEGRIIKEFNREFDKEINQEKILKSALPMTRLRNIK